jgi:Na+/H+-translocating membrane pyrophosphatase
LIGFCVFLGILIGSMVEPPSLDGQYTCYTTVAFFIGVFTSMFSGYIGMRIAVEANVRTALRCCDSINEGYVVAIQGG